MYVGYVSLNKTPDGEVRLSVRNRGDYKQSLTGTMPLPREEVLKLASALLKESVKHVTLDTPIMQSMQFQNDETGYAFLQWVNELLHARGLPMATWHNAQMVIPMNNVSTGANVMEPGDWLVVCPRNGVRLMNNEQYHSWYREIKDGDL